MPEDVEVHSSGTPNSRKQRPPEAIRCRYTSVMPSKARKRFDEQTEDVTQLLDIHEQIGGTKRGRRNLEVLNKSAIVLITAFWEAYCEDLAEEALDHIVNNVADASKLPKELRKRVAKELKEDKNDTAVWTLADAGWKAKVKSRLADLAKERNWDLNTPKSAKIVDLFDRAIGCTDVAVRWDWKGKGSKPSKDRLDEFVTLRGSIAHRGHDAVTVKKKDVEEYFELVKHLAARTGAEVNKFVKGVTGKKLW